MTTQSPIPSSPKRQNPTDPPIPSGSPDNGDQAETRRASPLPINPALIAEFLETDTFGDLSRDALYEKAREFLLAHSPQLWDIVERVNLWRTFTQHLATFKESATELRISLSAEPDNSTAKAALSELAPSLDEYLARNQLASRRRSSETAAATPDDLLTRVERATTRLERLIGEQSEIVESTVTNFVSSAESRAQKRAEIRAMREIEHELHERSRYYPRGSSPEAYALQFGLLRMPGGAQGSRSMLELYRRVERGSEDLARGALEESERDRRIPEAQGYFARLKELKALLRHSKSDTRLGPLRDLHTLYLESGSAALAYFSALDRLAVGDHSHDTLYAASHAAAQLRRQPELIETLRVLTESESNPVLLFHLYRILLSDGAREADSRYEQLLTCGGRAPEHALGAAVRALAQNRLPEATDHAMGAYAEAKRARGAEPLALDALRTALTATVRGDGDHRLREKLALKILQRDREDLLGWDTVLAPLFGGESIEWERITSHLVQFGGVEGYVRAADAALRKEHLSRAEEFLNKARELDTRGVRALLASVELAHNRGEVEAAQRFLTLAMERAPHHPELPAWSGHAAIHVQQESRSEDAEEAVAPSFPITVPAWSPAVRAQIIAARKMEGVPFLHALRERCDEFAAAYILLAPQSTLLTSQYESLKQIRMHLAAVRPLSEIRFGESDWNRNAAGIYQALNPKGFENPVGSYANSLRELHSALDSLDPLGDQFRSLRHHSRIVALAQNAREAYVHCAQAVISKSTPAERLCLLREFIKSLETFDRTLSAIVATDILHGARRLELWAAQVEAIPLTTLRGDIHTRAPTNTSSSG